MPIRPLPVLLAVAILSAGCSPSQRFEDNEQLANYIAALVPPSSSLEQARASLAQHGFDCLNDKAGEGICRRQLSSFPCKQVQLAFLPATGGAVGKVRTRLDHICP
ncbi:hypothetical protein J2X20_004252 [Pelomonas saccharophila]|uniref:Lipoprotein n=1 Tax=Roseateles saccharophilus TaxID=304 RepID=A0ABU1YRV3_ROSSA|nr:hypothetical protein [Roseateles saccharophilus]MDR7271584.1 hypothetical protein [Roseateles saccharophilus]